MYNVFLCISFIFFPIISWIFLHPGFDDVLPVESWQIPDPYLEAMMVAW